MEDARAGRNEQGRRWEREAWLGSREMGAELGRAEPETLREMERLGWASRARSTRRAGGSSASWASARELSAQETDAHSREKMGTCGRSVGRGEEDKEEAARDVKNLKEGRRVFLLELSGAEIRSNAGKINVGSNPRR
jgi:hypothetical protein